MQCFRNLQDLPHELRGGAIALGNFDGLHHGHRAVIDLARQAKAADAPLGVVMFDPPPRAYFQPDAPPFRIMSMERRAALLDEMGVDYCLALPFDQSIASMTDEAFCRSILHEGLGITAVSVGFDFRFGKGRMGDVESLKRFGVEMGFDVLIAEKVEEGTEKASSTQIRNFICEGDLAAAAHALHGYWRVLSSVEHGEKRGRTLGYPTLNLTLGDMLHPRHGVYAVWARFEDEDEWRPSVASFGRTPTTGLRDPLLEVFIFDWEGDAYGRKVEIAFGKFLRGEEKFDSLDALIVQMDKDSAAAKVFLAEAEAPN